MWAIKRVREDQWEPGNGRWRARLHRHCQPPDIHLPPALYNQPIYNGCKQPYNHDAIGGLQYWRAKSAFQKKKKTEKHTSMQSRVFSTEDQKWSKISISGKKKCKAQSLCNRGSSVSKSKNGTKSAFQKKKPTVKHSPSLCNQRSSVLRSKNGAEKKSSCNDRNPIPKGKFMKFRNCASRSYFYTWVWTIAEKSLQEHLRNTD